MYRDLMTLAYFSQLQPGIAQPAPLNSVVPYKYVFLFIYPDQFRIFCV